MITCSGIGVLLKLLDRRFVAKAANQIVTKTKMNPTTARMFLNGMKFAHLDIDDIDYHDEELADDSDEESNF